MLKRPPTGGPTMAGFGGSKDFLAAMLVVAAVLSGCVGSPSLPAAQTPAEERLHCDPCATLVVKGQPYSGFVRVAVDHEDGQHVVISTLVHDGCRAMAQEVPGCPVGVAEGQTPTELVPFPQSYLRVYTSFDGGNSFTEATLADPLYAGHINGYHGVGFAGHGTVLVASLAQRLPLNPATHEAQYDQVAVLRSTDGGLSFSAKMIVADLFGTVEVPSFLGTAMDGSGQALLTWVQEGREQPLAPWRRMFSASTDGGATWSQPAVFDVVESPYSRLTHPMIAGANWTVFDAEQEPGCPTNLVTAPTCKRTLQAHHSEDGGKTWTSATSEWKTNGRIAITQRAGGDLASSQIQRVEDGSIMMVFGASSDGGATWQEMQRLPDATNGTFTAPSMLESAGALWTLGANGPEYLPAPGGIMSNPACQQSVRALADGELREFPLEGGCPSDIYPGIAAIDGGVVVAWAGVTEGGDDAVFAARVLVT